MDQQNILLAAVSRFDQPTGICRSAANHAISLSADRSRFRVSVVVGAWQKDYYATALGLGAHGVDILVAKCQNNSASRNLWYHQELPKYAANVDADIVHLSFPVPIKRSKFSIPVCATIHDLYPYDHPQNFGFPQVVFNRLFIRRCVSQSDGFVCVSEYTRGRFAHYFPDESTGKPVKTIYSFSGLNDIRPVRPEQFPFERFIMSVAQHRDNKNLDLLVNAFEKLSLRRLNYDDLGLLIVGAAGPETKALMGQISRSQFRDRIFLMSNLADNELAWLYRSCSAFVAASSIEGFCLPLVEAMQLSPRVICSDIPIFREIAARRCEFFTLKENAASNLASALEASLSTSNAASLDKRFCKDTAHNQYLQLYTMLHKQ